MIPSYLGESAARRHIPITMEDWANCVDCFLLADDRNILKDAGKVRMKISKNHTESEFEKYRVVQARLYKNDFDKLERESTRIKRVLGLLVEHCEPRGVSLCMVRILALKQLFLEQSKGARLADHSGERTVRIRKIESLILFVFILKVAKSKDLATF